MCWPCNECVEGLPDILNFWCHERDLSITVNNFVNVNPYDIICIATLCMADPPSYIFLKATRCVECSRCTNNPIVCMTWATCSSLDGLTEISSLLPFVLARAPNTCKSASIGGEYYDPLRKTQFLWPPSTLVSISLDSVCFLLQSHSWPLPCGF